MSIDCNSQAIHGKQGTEPQGLPYDSVGGRPVFVLNELRVKRVVGCSRLGRWPI